jgi:hypothetical protein
VEKPFLELGERIVEEISNGTLNAQELSANGIKIKPEPKTINIQPIDPNTKTGKQ